MRFSPGTGQVHGWLVVAAILIGGAACSGQPSSNGSGSSAQSSQTASSTTSSSPTSSKATSTDTLSPDPSTGLPSSGPSPTTGDLPSETVAFTHGEQPIVDQLPAGTTGVDTGDGGLAALDSSGALVRGWGSPGGGASLVARGADVVLQPGAQTTSPATIPVVTRLIERAVWSTADGRPRLKVTPTGWGRTWRSNLLVHAAWLQVVAGEPSADTSGMENQYRCHAEFAPTKTRFNLEPWRPAGDYLSVVLAGCNPGGPEPP